MNKDLKKASNQPDKDSLSSGELLMIITFLNLIISVKLLPRIFKWSQIHA